MINAGSGPRYYNHRACAAPVGYPGQINSSRNSSVIHQLQLTRYNECEWGIENLLEHWTRSLRMVLMRQHQKRLDVLPTDDASQLDMIA